MFKGSLFSCSMLCSETKTEISLFMEQKLILQPRIGLNYASLTKNKSN